MWSNKGGWGNSVEPPGTYPNLLCRLFDLLPDPPPLPPPPDPEWCLHHPIPVWPPFPPSPSISPHTRLWNMPFPPTHLLVEDAFELPLRRSLGLLTPACRSHL